MSYKGESSFPFHRSTTKRSVVRDFKLKEEKETRPRTFDKSLWENRFLASAVRFRERRRANQSLERRKVYHAASGGAVDLAGAEVALPDGYRRAVGLQALLQIQERDAGLQKGGGERGRGAVSAPAGGHALPFAEVLPGQGKADGANDLGQRCRPGELH